MKINCKPTKVKLSLRGRGLLVLFGSLIFFFTLLSVSFAPTKMDDSKFTKTRAINFAENKVWKMSDEELADISAQAFFSLTQNANLYGSQNVITLNLGARVDILAHIDSFKIGYYIFADPNNDPLNNIKGWGWDYNVTNYYFGGSDQDSNANAERLVWKGIFLQVGFDNISSPTQRRLNYVDFGTMSASGPVTGSFRMLNALASTSGTGQNNGVLVRQAAGRQTITFANEPLTFLFASKYNYNTNSSGYGYHLHGFFQKIPNQVTKLGYTLN